MRSINSDGPMYGWTFHQSHDQATVLFLVPQSISASDLDIRLASDHVSASIPDHPPIIQAKLYGRVNTDTSTWRIGAGDQSRKRSSRSFARASPAATSSSDYQQNRRDRPAAQSHATSQTSQAQGPSTRLESPQASHSSMSASIVSLQSGSSYEVLSHSTPSSQPPSSAPPTAEWSSGSSDLGSSDSADASLSQSAVLSDPGDVRSRYPDHPHASHAADRTALRRTQSTTSIAASTSHGSDAAASPIQPVRASPQAGPPQVRLVTLHLDKVDSGIWPLLVVGPAPLQADTLPSRLTQLLGSDLPRNRFITEPFIHESIQRRRGARQEEQQRSAAQLQLNQALQEALSGFEGGDRVLAAIRRGVASSSNPSGSHVREERASRSSMDSDEDFGPNTSTLSINTIASDESATVLGSRVTSLAGTSAALERDIASTRDKNAEREAEDEVMEAWKELQVMARYNMDPTTLSLIGLQFANGYSTQTTSTLASQLSRTGPTGIPEAFEYFARAWRVADVSLATERLVLDFLPLLPSTSSGANVQEERLLPPKLDEILELSLLKGALTLPPTSDVISTQLRERLHSHSYMSLRHRLVASLGGPKALARLYASYARLHLPSLSSNRSPLAFPYGQLTSPFVSGGHAAMHLASSPRRTTGRNTATSTSSRTPSLASLTFGGADGGAASTPKSSRAPHSPTVAESSRVASPDHATSQGAISPIDFSDFLVQSDQSTAAQPAPFYFLREACMLDSDVTTQISAEEWTEALVMALERQERRKAELEALAQAEEMGSLAGDSESGCLNFDSDSETQRRRLQRRSKDHGDAASSGGLAGLFNLGWRNETRPSDSSRKRSVQRPRSAEKSKRRRERRGSKTSREQQEAGVLNFVSGAALLGVALAGSVAALGWWRRTSAALNSPA